MKLKVKSDEKNDLLSRREIVFEVQHDGEPTPPKADVTDNLVAKLNANEDLLIIKGYKTQFGRNTTPGICYVYETQKAMEKAEPDKVLNTDKRLGKREGAVDETPDKEEE